MSEDLIQRVTKVIATSKRIPLETVTIDRDRKSVVEGKRVDLGGRRIIKKKKKEQRYCGHHPRAPNPPTPPAPPAPRPAPAPNGGRTVAGLRALAHALLYRFFFFSSRRRHTRCLSDWSSDVCSSD